MRVGIIPFVLSIVVVLAAPSALAEDQRLAERLVELTRFEQKIDGLRSSMLQGLRQDWMQRIEQQRQRLTQEQVDHALDLLPKIEAIFKEEFDAFDDEIEPHLKKLAVSFYKEKLSVDELQELIAIFERPSMQKMLDLDPEAGQLGTELVLQHTGRLQQRLDRRLNELKQKLPAP